MSDQISSGTGLPFAGTHRLQTHGKGLPKSFPYFQRDSALTGFLTLPFHWVMLLWFVLSSPGLQEPWWPCPAARCPITPVGSSAPASETSPTTLRLAHVPSVHLGQRQHWQPCTPTHSPFPSSFGSLKLSSTSHFNYKPQSLSAAGPWLCCPSPPRLGALPTAASSEQGCVAAFPVHILNAPFHEPALEQERESGVKPQSARPACLRRAIWLGSPSKLNLLDGFEGH